MTYPSATLGELCIDKPQYGANAKAIARTSVSQPRYIRITDIDANGQLIPNGVAADVSDFSTYLLREGDLLIARSGNTVGKSYLHPKGAEPSLFAGYLIRFQLSHKRINPRFAFFFTKSERYNSWLDSKRRVAGQPNINGTEYASLELPLPALPEQDRIVEVLDQADTLRQQRRQADSIYPRFLTALFHQMFGDPATMSKRYSIGTFEDVLISTKNGLYKHADFYGEGIPILKMFNIYQGSLRMDRVDRVTLEPAEHQAYRLSVGDILFNRVNTPELVGKCAVIDQNADGAVFESKNIRAILDLKKVSPYFACFFYNTEYGHKELTRRLKHAAGMATITGPHVREAPFPQVPLDLQLKFEGHCQTMAKSWTESLKSASTLETLFQTLLHRAFDGSLTAKWREGQGKELLQEMEKQAKQ